MPTGYESGKTWSPIGAQPAVSTSAASRVWTMNEVAAYEGADTWPAPQVEGFEKIGSTNAGGTTTVTFTGIDSTKYQTYMVVWKTINSTTTLDNRVRLNGTNDASGNIYQSNWRYKGSSGNAQSNQNAETYPMVGGTPKGSNSDQVFSQTWVCGPSLSTGKPMYQYWGSLNDGSNPIRVGFAYNTAFYNSTLTNPTTIITVNNGVTSQNFPTGTIVSAYGYRLNA